MAALKIGPGDEVIVPDSTFVATASAVLFAGAMPVMVDVLSETDCIDPDLVEAAITPRTKAIIAVHLGGHPADVDRLCKISARRSEERRVGKECRSRWSAEHEKKKKRTWS